MLQKYSEKQKYLLRLTQLVKTPICTRGMTCYCPIHLGPSSQDSNNLSKALNSQGFIFPAKHCYNLLSSLTTFCIHTSYTSLHMHNILIHFKNNHHTIHTSLHLIKLMLLFQFIS